MQIGGTLLMAVFLWEKIVLEQLRNENQNVSLAKIQFETCQLIHRNDFRAKDSRRLIIFRSKLCLMDLPTIFYYICKKICSYSSMKIF